MLNKFRRAVENAAYLLLYAVIVLGIFTAIVMTTLAQFGFRWGPGA